MYAYSYHGEDSITWHSDKTQDLTHGSVIALISLGAEREFQFQNISTGKVTAFPLQAGDLVLMDWDLNLKYKHRLAKAPKEELQIRRTPGAVVEPRISLVFRDIKTAVSRTNVEKRTRRTERVRENRKRERESLADEKSNTSPTEENDPDSKKRERVDLEMDIFTDE